MAYRFYSLFVLFVLSCTPVWATADTVEDKKPTVLATIKPLAMIAADIGGDHIIVQQLLPANGSPHNFSLKVSDRMKLEQADLLLWIGESLDGYAGKLVSDKHRSLAADQLSGISWPQPPGHHGKDDNHAHGHHEGCGCVQHDGGDPHIWLNPENVILIAAELAARLGQIDPQNRQYYRQASDRFAEQLREFDQNARQQLAELPKRQFVVQHDAYGHFINRYRLHQMGSLRSISGARVGTKSLAKLLDQGEGGLACILTDPQFNAKPAVTFSERTGLPMLPLDPQGYEIPLNRESGQPFIYQRFLQTFVNTFTECLQQ